MQTITVKLAGQEVQVEELPSRRNAAWRERWMRELLTADTVRGALLDYAPALAGPLDSPDLYDSGVNAAFWEVMALADPFGRPLPRPITEAPPATEPN